MGSSYSGEPNLGSERSTNSRKGRKSNQEKPRQPQRGLGVAQLEKIRLYSQMGYSHLPPPPLQNPLSPNLTQEDMRRQTAYSPSSSFIDSPPSSSSFGFQGSPSTMLGASYLDRENAGYAESRADIAGRWSPGNVFLDTQQFTQPIITRQLFEQEVEDSPETRRRKDRSDSQNYESNGNQELDLELRLSL